MIVPILISYPLAIVLYAYTILLLLKSYDFFHQPPKQQVIILIKVCRFSSRRSSFLLNFSHLCTKYT
jgi:hypothetical protein